ncbi:MAG: MBL fold metallo-hydrolase, partial [Phycisphaerae bacterium]|nr:MBL fold metallo-hydrolase [Phycisphaerae bacterium]
CAHPDIVEILRNIHDNMEGPIDLVFGGFHLLDQTKDETLKTIEAFRGFGVRRAGACHCTGSKAIQVFREQYADDFLEIGAGTVIEIDT